MPELPEVETVRRSLETHLVGRRLLAATGAPVKLRRPFDPEAVAAAVRNRTVRTARRRGKYLLIDLTSEWSLLVHLGMTGRLSMVGPATALAPHTHLRVSTDDGRELRFIDARRFGFVQVLAPGAEHHDPSLCRLGIEALDPELTWRLPALMRARRAPIKNLLLDQRLVAGVGNIYATEALWRAGIRPSRPGHRISELRLRALAGHLQDVLREAIAEGGTTLRDFATPEGGSGYFRISLAVYDRAGAACPRCGEILRPAVISGRSSVWCTNCQR